MPRAASCAAAVNDTARVRTHQKDTGAAGAMGLFSYLQFQLLCCCSTRRGKGHPWHSPVPWCGTSSCWHHRCRYQTLQIPQAWDRGLVPHSQALSFGKQPSDARKPTLCRGLNHSFSSGWCLSITTNPNHSSEAIKLPFATQHRKRLFVFN